MRGLGTLCRHIRAALVGVATRRLARVGVPRLIAVLMRVLIIMSVVMLMVMSVAVVVLMAMVGVLMRFVRVVLALVGVPLVSLRRGAFIVRVPIGAALGRIHCAAACVTPAATPASTAATRTALTARPLRLCPLCAGRSTRALDATGLGHRMLRLNRLRRLAPTRLIPMRRLITT
jgi:hypothetical protein